jgi:hypothetical protein
MPITFQVAPSDHFVYMHKAGYSFLIENWRHQIQRPAPSVTGEGGPFVVQNDQQRGFLQDFAWRKWHY